MRDHDRDQGRERDRERSRERAQARRAGAGEAGATRRRALLGFLETHACGFEDLRRQLGVAARVLEDDLRHVERTAKAEGRRLVVEPAVCRACGFTFHGRVSRRLAAPGRCPRCRSERIEDVRLHIEGPARGGGGRARTDDSEEGTRE